MSSEDAWEPWQDGQNSQVEAVSYESVQEACQIVGTGQNAAAEAVLRKFSQSPTLLSDAQNLLSSARDPPVVFHVLGAILKRLPSLLYKDDQRNIIDGLLAMRDWLLSYSTQSQYPSFVQIRLAHTIACLTKCSTQIQQVDPIMHLADFAAAQINSTENTVMGLQLVVAITEDFSMRSKNADELKLGLQSEVHVWCHAVLQMYAMQSLIPAVLSALYNSLHNQHGLLPAAQATYATLSWDWNACLIDQSPNISLDHLANLLQNNQSPQQAMPCRIPASLGHLLTSAELPTLLNNAAHQALCIAQTDSTQSWAMQRAYRDLRSSMLLVAAYESPPDEKQQWIEQRAALVQVLCDQIQEASNQIVQATSAESIENYLDELRFLSQLSIKLVSGPTCDFLLAADPSELQRFLHALATLTQTTLETVLEKLPTATDLDSEILSEAETVLSEVLELWRSLLNSVSMSEPSEVLSAIHAHVRDHVVPVYFSKRLQYAALNLDSIDQVREEDIDDFDLYDDQLTWYAALARSCLDNIMPSLTTTLNELHTSLESTASDALWEQLHWVTLIGAYLVADPAVAEQPSVPREVSDASSSTQEALLGFLHANTLVILPGLLRHGPTELNAASPQVITTLLKFAARWIPTYLLRSEDTAIIQPLKDDAGEQVLDSILSSLQMTLDIWRSDNDVLIAATAVLEALANSPGAMSRLLSRSSTNVLLQATLSSLESFPDAVHKYLIRAFVKCLNRAQDSYQLGAEEARSLYYPLILNAVHIRLQSAIQAAASNQIPSILSAFSLVETIAENIDAYVSRSVLARLHTELPVIIEISRSFASDSAVLNSALKASKALAQSLEDGIDVYEYGNLVDPVCTLLHLSLPALQDASDDQTMLLVSYLETTQALIQLNPSDDQHSCRIHAELPIKAWLFAVNGYTRETLRDLPAKEALVNSTTALLLNCKLNWYIPAQHLLCETVSPLDLLDEPSAHLFSVQSQDLVEVLLRCTSLCLGSSDTTTEVMVAAMPPALDRFLAPLTVADSAHLCSPFLQNVLDHFAWDLVRALLLNPLHLPTLSALVLALRTVTLTRVHPLWPDGQASYSASFQRLCHEQKTLSPPLLIATVSTLLQHILDSRPADLDRTLPPALAARLVAKQEKSIVTNLCRTLRPIVLHARSRLCIY
ncbi:hypothetical protein MYAM1_002733 [Malassezia yamatoensis]|uniref:Uncharacterized protein n=1 Tax=Malassezia yamatoensis TaxID=253288 RepID=A0AAJ6CJP3_9BASI|nr:hypothetical protein MYAM1_002733 [Malassezia yamatoensis]